MTLDDEWLVPPPATLLAGCEKFVGSSATVQDFWRFALGDLRMNNARGYLAEFIVAQALGLSDARRVEWDAYDILWDDITIEVKSSAYLQSWDQRRRSKIVFSGLKGTRFHARHGYDPAGKRFNAMVYVFCVHTATAHESYEQLDLGQWDVYVVPRRKLQELNQTTAGLATVQRLSNGPIRLAGLRDTVLDAAQGEELDDAPWWAE
jgi:hypothetical protein